MKKNIFFLLFAISINSIFAADDKVTNFQRENIIIPPLYENIREAFNKMSYFELPDIENLIILIKNPNFASDGSENSIFYYVIKYIEKIAIREMLEDPNSVYGSSEKIPCTAIVNHIKNGNTIISRKKLGSLFKAIRWDNLTSLYLNTIVAQVVEMFNEPELNNLYHQEKQKRTNNKLFSESLTARKQLEPKNLLIMKCVFENVNDWKEDKRQYSPCLIFHGYEIYYFLQCQKPQNPNAGQPIALAGFLGCLGPFDANCNLNLPIAYKVIILEAARFRRYQEMKVVYQKPIGRILTINGETFESVVTGQAPFVINNVITAILGIEFLDDDGANLENFQCFSDKHD